MGEFLKDNRLTRAAIAAVAVVAAFYIIRKLQNKIKEQENSVENVFSSEQITTAIKQNATISKARAAQLAEQIKSSWGFLNDNEAAIYKAFEALNNEFDLALLMQVYIHKGENLQQSITKRMNQRERNKLNEILFKKGIEVTF